MKCPECNHNQKYAYGMICGSCGYQFALDPKKMPKLTDVAFGKMLDRVSGDGEYYFTYNQLVAQIYRKFTRAGQTLEMCIIATLVFAGIAVFFNVSNIFPEVMTRNATAIAIIFLASSWLSFLMGHKWIGKIFFTIICIGAAVFFNLHTGVIIFLTIFLLFDFISFFGLTNPRMSAICKKIDTYHAVHPIEKMVDGKAFEYLDSDAFDKEIFQYAPDRILIVERNSIADMLLLNRFHLENKTLVVSEGKYPFRAFRACQRYLSHYPNMEIVLMHDASKKGLRMKDRLLSEPSWHLGGRHIRDLGLFPDDVARLKNPMWLPKSDGKIVSGGKPAERIRNGCIMPSDVPISKALMNAMGGAAALGLPLLSEELIAQQRDSLSYGGGYGFG